MDAHVKKAEKMRNVMRKVGYKQKKERNPE